MSSPSTSPAPKPIHRAARWRWSANSASPERPVEIHAPQLESKEHLLLLKEKQQTLRTRLAIAQEQQLAENFKGLGRSVFSMAYPDSLTMIISGLHEQLERVTQEIASYQQ